jgi:hypothetical protein
MSVVAIRIGNSSCVADNCDSIHMPPRNQAAKPQAQLAGVSPTAVRGFLLQSAESPSWTAAYLQKTLAIDGQTARGVLTALSAVGYIEPDPEQPRNWRNTEAGNKMAGDLEGAADGV